MAKYTEIPLSLKVVEKEPLDAKEKVQTLAEAQRNAYNGYQCFVTELNHRIEFVELNGELVYRTIGGYTHPETHPASIIEQDANHRFITDTERTKLQGLENYQHPETHPASIIEQDASHRFATDAEKASWNDKYSRNEVDNKFTAFTEEIDWKEAVDTFDEIYTTYPTPEHGWTVYVRSENKKYTYNGEVWVNTSSGEIPLATHELNGLLSATDKAKLDTIEPNANDYLHPETHPASMIEESSTRRFVTATGLSRVNQLTVDGLGYLNSGSTMSYPYLEVNVRKRNTIGVKIPKSIEIYLKFPWGDAEAMRFRRYSPHLVVLYKKHVRGFVADPKTYRNKENRTKYAIASNNQDRHSPSINQLIGYDNFNSHYPFFSVTVDDLFALKGSKNDNSVYINRSARFGRRYKEMSLSNSLMTTRYWRGAFAIAIYSNIGVRTVLPNMVYFRVGYQIRDLAPSGKTIADYFVLE
jgi:hypothetical protein